ncbi:oxygen-independent coproporphyrinogen III oxidase [Sphingomonas ginsenosidivorax]|uniref:Coproporphyrinogen-III oxidase n=1 Tax=Sphingomonas ginsenosidivorax TaxID=862135 RepID=A0A5C6UJE0_9SPHN|nr:oxygen-independent coproporphyrinogen III oxidase [Sphingomonas ginsenosidivorax]TXC72346.1 oxygen-independent coproporphyrinogen III oxidase [Sphingomonas ginsenosidivorax]
MWTYHPDLLAVPVPRYTSYPTAAAFDDRVGHADMQAGLAGIAADDTVSLYVHIPYCRQICWYCGCNTGAANRSARLDAYLERLEQEIARVADRVGHARVGRIAFGGGSPNAVAPAQFARLVDLVTTRFRCDDPVLSVEIDPRGFTAEWAAMLAAHRVSRVSLGVQTLDPAIQAAIGRVQPADEIRRVMDLLRRADIGSINFDLMYGLPGQSEAALEATLVDSLAMAPDRFAVFGYAHVPAMIPRQRRIDASALPDARARFAQAALAHATLTAGGHVAIGFDHFAVPGDALALASANGTLRRNFQGFTEDQATTLIGLGVSAISEFPDRLLQNAKNTGRYHLLIAAGRFATVRGLRRTAEDRVRARAIEKILTRGTADLSGVADLAGVRDRLTPFERRQLVRWEGATLWVLVEARPYARSIAAAVDQYQSAARQFSTAV